MGNTAEVHCDCHSGEDQNLASIFTVTSTMNHTDSKTTQTDQLGRTGLSVLSKEKESWLHVGCSSTPSHYYCTLICTDEGQSPHTCARWLEKAQFLQWLLQTKITISFKTPKERQKIAPAKRAPSKKNILRDAKSRHNLVEIRPLPPVSITSPRIIKMSTEWQMRSYSQCLHLHNLLAPAAQSSPTLTLSPNRGQKVETGRKYEKSAVTPSSSEERGVYIALNGDQGVNVNTGLGSVQLLTVTACLNL